MYLSSHSLQINDICAKQCRISSVPKNAEMRKTFRLRSCGHLEEGLLFLPCQPSNIDKGE